MILQGIPDPFVASLFQFYGLTYCEQLNPKPIQNLNVDLFQYTDSKKRIHKYNQKCMKI